VAAAAAGPGHEPERAPGEERETGVDERAPRQQRAGQVERPAGAAVGLAVERPSVRGECEGAAAEVRSQARGERGAGEDERAGEGAGGPERAIGERMHGAERERRADHDQDDDRFLRAADEPQRARPAQRHRVRDDRLRKVFDAAP
jgi:hypothetical protein